MPDDNLLVKLRTAVTGFNGFIGTCFVNKLRSLNIPVILLEGDVRSSETWKEDFDVLYHFAAMMPAKFVDSPHEAFSVNFDGVLNALDACRRNKAQMVFTSTCGVYKPDKMQPFSEEHPLEPPTAYTQSKLIGEMLCRTYAKHYGVKSTVLRLFNVYGTGQGPGYIIPYLIKCGREGCRAEVYHPESSRDFIHVKDVVDLLLRVIKIREERSEEGSHGSFGPIGPQDDQSRKNVKNSPTGQLVSVYNVGSGKSHTIAEVIELIGQVCEKKISYKRIESTEDPQPFVCANIARAVHDLGWSVKVSLKDGIQEIVNNFHQVAQ